MKSYAQFSIQPFNSFNINATSPHIYFPETLTELAELANESLTHCYILGEGSNSLFCSTQAPMIVKPSFKGIEIAQDKAYFTVRVACAENWHDFVQFCVSRQIYGLENLALIPGSVGAAPVQNIGAYGVEVSNFIESISWFDFTTKTVIEYDKSECQFAYRDSIFKAQLKGQGVITHVQFKFPKAWQPVLSYQGLSDLNEPISAEKIMNKVIELRASKLPDPKVLANAGSFFKNPVVSESCFEIMKQQYPDMPNYKQSSGDVKLAAGWLIEQAGLKGYRTGKVGVHKKQALVLVNFGGASGSDIVKLSQHVQKVVMEKFKINLIPEVRFVDSHGEIDSKTGGSWV